MQKRNITYATHMHCTKSGHHPVPVSTLVSPEYCTNGTCQGASRAVPQSIPNHISSIKKTHAPLPILVLPSTRATAP